MYKYKFIKGINYVDKGGANVWIPFDSISYIAEGDGTHCIVYLKNSNKEFMIEQDAETVIAFYEKSRESQ